MNTITRISIFCLALRNVLADRKARRMLARDMAKFRRTLTQWDH